MTLPNLQVRLSAPFSRYFGTAIALCFPVYATIRTALHFAASRPDLPFSFLGLWPVLFLIVPIGLLLISAIASLKQPHRASRIASIAAWLAWCYYVLMICPLLWFPAIGFLGSIVNVLAFTLPGLPLAFTTIYAYQASRTSRPV